MPLLLLFLLLAPVSASAKDLGELSANPYQENSTANPFGAGSPFAPNGMNNPFSPYGSPFSNQSAMNPFATDAPRLYDQQGNYRGNLNANPLRLRLNQQPLRPVRFEVFARLHQQSVRRRQSVSLRESHQSLRPRLANRRTVVDSVLRGPPGATVDCFCL